MIDTQDKKDEVKQEAVKTQEEIKKVDDTTSKDASYKAEPKNTNLKYC